MTEPTSFTRSKRPGETWIVLEGGKLMITGPERQVIVIEPDTIDITGILARTPQCHK